jgi:serine protease Do
MTDTNLQKILFEAPDIQRNNIFDAEYKSVNYCIYFSEHISHKLSKFLNQFCRLSIILLLLSILSCQNSLEKSSQKVLPATVTIYTYDKHGKNLTQGSGFFINKDGGILTNKHVIINAHGIKIKTFSDQLYDITHVVAEDTVNDLIILQSDAPLKYVTPLKIRSKSPNVGEKIFTVGSPEGFETSLSEGIISSIRELDGFGTVYQLTAPVSSGSSGGPVLNMSGNAIGVVTFKYTEGHSLNFALPISHLSQLANDKILPFSTWKKVRDSISIVNLYRDGWHLKTQENCREAIILFNNVLLINDEEYLALFYIGRCYLDLQEYNIAIEYFDKSLEVYSVQAEAKERKRKERMNRYMSYNLDKPHTKEELEAVQKYLMESLLSPQAQEDPHLAQPADESTTMQDYSGFVNRIAAQVGRGELMEPSQESQRKKRIESYISEANRYFPKTEPISPHWDIFFYRGQAKKELRNYSGAINDYTIYVDNTDVGLLTSIFVLFNVWKAYDEISEIHKLRHDYDKAIKNYNRQIDSFKDRYTPTEILANTYFGRGWSKGKVNDYYGSIEDFSEAINLVPNEGSFYFYRGLAYLGIDKYGEGCDDLWKAVQLGNESAMNVLKGDLRLLCK